jgi:lipopolysaccharide export system protein LptA
MRHRLSALLCAAALLGPLPSYALTGDKDQPIHIEADRVDIDDVKRVSVYRGNVRYTQGSMRLDADKVSIYYDEQRNFQRVRAEGQPARFRQRLDGQAEDMLGEAMQIDYTVAPERLVLKQQAHIWNQGDEFAGEIITYDITEDRVVARRGDAQEDRVQVVIQPRPPADDAAPDAEPQQKPD